MDDAFLDLLSKCQGHRLDDQRSDFPSPLQPGDRTSQVSNDEDDLFETLLRLQGARIEEQRCSMPPLSKQNEGESLSSDELFELIFASQVRTHIHSSIDMASHRHIARVLRPFKIHLSFCLFFAEFPHQRPALSRPQNHPPSQDKHHAQWGLLQPHPAPTVHQNRGPAQSTASPGQLNTKKRKKKEALCVVSFVFPLPGCPMSTCLPSPHDPVGCVVMGGYCLFWSHYLMPDQHHLLVVKL